MKKFYIPIFTAVLLFTSFLSQGQVFNSITSNPSNYTLDDGRFWQGGVAPGNPCTGCQINIYSSVSVVQNGFSSVAAYNPPVCTGSCTFLNDVALLGGSINVYGNNVTLTISTYLQLFNTTITIGNDPTSVESIKLNDQVDLNGTATIRLANVNSWVNVNGTPSPVIQGPHVFFDNSGKYPGIYSIIPPDINGFTYTAVLTPHGIGTSTNQYLPGGSSFYQINCAPGDPTSVNDCGAGFVYGPAETTANGTFGLIFTGATTLPVQLVQFIANKVSDGSVRVSWATAQEQNSDYFNVERSGDQASWSTLGSVKARGYASTTTNYSFSDKKPLDGNNYYRLKMVDLDGKVKYSGTVLVSSSSSNQPLVIYSNPFNDKIRMKVNVSRAQNLIMTVSDLVGKTIISQNYPAQAGDNYPSLQPNGAASGMYILHIHGDSYDQTVKLEKQ